MGSRTSPPTARTTKHLSCVPGGPVPHRTTDALLRCLIVDDNRRILRAVNDVLNHDGIVVVGLASTSTEALGLASRHRPDVVLSDVELGPESGFDLAWQLMMVVPAWQPTVILMSASPEEEFDPMLEASPAAAFIPKLAISGPAVREVHRRHRNGRPSTGSHRTAAPLCPAGHAETEEIEAVVRSMQRNESRRQTGPCRRSEGRSR